ncbi:MAG: hypothetical protein QF921_03020 [Pseudomonadales bacterium]|jgi:hypothetical protein|nr:hypothetical protein [Pseudomonadales bacterium]MDP6471209.1 hypothetical protein [Pseudomonadales bacterium]MDP6825602.1 hypothetical protein [Pseudomonadales bacterium]MDP6970481.1 hypothetical protein [Pseudomonadales bacterium]|tara:strand:- start:3205 stop:3723 length:519 start_codon:yes stop_codon:yes gene_type:complete
MKQMKPLPALALLTTMILCNSASGTALLEPGDAFPAFDARDQHDTEYQFQPGTRTVLIAFDMQTAKKTNKKLANLDAGFLADNEAVFISNIYGMPRVGRLFALPKMRKYPHRIVLADAENLLSLFPRKADRVTIIRLNASAAVLSVDFWNPGEEELWDYFDRGATASATSLD